ncbi:hypothetical protein T439DRAFT_181025 [Meredithblackwellia eburnea MCA 4105]
MAAAEFVTTWTSRLRTLQAQVDASSSAVPQLVNSSQQLGRELTEWAERIPTYELRRCESELKILNEALSVASNKSNPKTKFSFKKKLPFAPTEISRATSSTPGPISPPSALLASNAAPSNSVPPVPSSARKLNCITSSYLSMDQIPCTSSNSSALVIESLSKCFVDFVRSPAGQAGKSNGWDVSALYLYDLKDSVLLLPSIEGSIMMHGCEGCLIVCAGHQIRMHNSKRCKVLAKVSSTPIIEGCSGLLFGSYPDFASISRVASSIDSQLVVQDFDHPFATASSPSPNWKLATVEEQRLSGDWLEHSRREANWEALRIEAFEKH